MKRLVLATLAVVIASWVVIPTLGFTTAAMMKDAGKKSCMDCHTAISGASKEDPKLNDEGKKFLKK